MTSECWVQHSPSCTLGLSHSASSCHGHADPAAPEQPPAEASKAVQTPFTVVLQDVVAKAAACCGKCLVLSSSKVAHPCNMVQAPDAAAVMSGSGASTRAQTTAGYGTMSELETVCAPVPGLGSACPASSQRSMPCCLPFSSLDPPLPRALRPHPPPNPPFLRLLLPYTR